MMVLNIFSESKKICDHITFNKLKLRRASSSKMKFTEPVEQATLDCQFKILECKAKVETSLPLF